MSDVDWDAEDFEPPQAQPAKLTDKWEGEDEDDSVKDNWDDEDEDSENRDDKDKKLDETAIKKKKKKKLADIIAEKEAKQIEEKERRKKEAEEREKALTPEEKLAEKLRMQKIQEDADLQLANDLMGTAESTVEEEEVLLDGLDISTTKGLESFRKAIVSKIRSTDRLEKRPFYVSFLEDLSRELCMNIEMEEVKKVSSVLNSLYNEKVKASKPKSKKKGGGKAKLNVGQGAIADDVGNDYGYNEYDDFI
ncbi:eukaryotic translation initiation factor 3 subunit J-like [Penaeus japonicus]|uniref:eukaryotic translation initiation factor 3 subunit J-like n=1 Tax=Penaeus japonicus TaxID=27405 RepID=UPI001C70EC96|nr:eukaryotic translation initiation factor 3 subunit J-like [Penaeus japonicus]